MRARFFRLHPAERRLLLQSLAWLLPIRVGLSLLPFGMVLRLQRKARAANGHEARADPEAVDRITRAVVRASRLVPGSRCLAQALAAQILLGRRGHAAELRIGVARAPTGKLLAHAWLEEGGRAIFERPHPDSYQPLTRIDDGTH